MRKQLGNTPRAPKPFGKPGARLANHSRAVRQDIAEEEVPGQIEALSNFVPGCTSAFADEARQAEQLPCIGSASAALTARPDLGLTATRSSLEPETAQRSRSRPNPSSARSSSSYRTNAVPQPLADGAASIASSRPSSA